MKENEWITSNKNEGLSSSDDCIEYILIANTFDTISRCSLGISWLRCTEKYSRKLLACIMGITSDLYYAC